MKEFDKIQTQMPYAETEAYVDELVERCGTLAKRQSDLVKNNRRALYISLAGLAAAAAVVLAVVIPGRERHSPMDNFLASISDAEADMIMDIQLDDIPEYY